MANTLRAKKINQIIYISLGGAVAIVTIFIILFNIFGSKKNKQIQVGDNSNVAKDASEQTSLSVGKKAGETEEYEDMDNNYSEQAQEMEQNNQVEEKQDTQNNENVEGTTNNSNSVNIVTANATESSNSNTTEENNNTAEANVENVEDNKEEEKDPTFIMPVEGEIVKHYGKEKLIYSDTLKEWTTHLGIDIKADKTTVVKSSSEGIVKSIKNDPRYGLTVVVEHKNGFSTVYSNLLTAEFVVVGEEVKAGQTLGTVGNSATFEIVDDPHLHFELLKDGNSVDPEMYVK